jgi:hypothetical protein
MVKRRKFLIGLGSLAAGGAAAMGTGAFTSASADNRTVSVGVETDSSSQIGLVAGDVPDVFQNSNGEIELDLTGAEGEGVNPNSEYTWGDPNNPNNNYAFALVNNDESNYENIEFTYTLNDASWVEDEGWESFIKFTVYRDGNFTKKMRAPNPYEPEKETSRGLADGIIFDSGEVWPVVVEVDTDSHSAEDLEQGDIDLSGKLTIEVSGRTQSSD